MSPQEYEERLFSIELDPPAEVLLGTLTNLLAQLIADQRNIHRGKNAPAVSPSAFLPPEPAEDDEDTEKVTDADVALAAHEDLRAGLGVGSMGGKRYIVPLVPRVGARVDPGLFAAMTGGGTTEGGE